MYQPTDQDMARARQIGDIFGGNGLPHYKQVALVAEKLAQWREEDRIEPTLTTNENELERPTQSSPPHPID